ncbi:unnamed protein product [Caenorhabditis auriculariae]|uniref:Uncharacterized protein n=1 Tax=Caenorhabditis auriculariae TaxID=2777116 RepID=A0A8S1H9A3_9PELO|nr:unnamed protein product [Caenorhabditis auriculariae]
MGDGNVVQWLMCGAAAGLAVDIGLYPLDTIKSRLQSKQGFLAAGGFRNIYRGMSSVLVGSAPGAAIFFLSYRLANRHLGEGVVEHAFSASLAEIAACAVRVPTELCKQRSQVKAGARLTEVARDIFQRRGFLGFYQGYFSTIAREIPFSMIQFPIWEHLKKSVARRKGRDECSALDGAICGSVAGSISAALTTPLDVAKTRIMLSKRNPPPRVLETLRDVAKTGGPKALFSGIAPRVMWISIGGFVFFGAYESSMYLTKFLF